MIARVFPRKTKMTPTTEHCYIGLPVLGTPRYDEVHISVAFTWDLCKVAELIREWCSYGKVKVGGPAFDSAGGEFVPGRYLKQGVTITSRGCPRSTENCPWCFVPRREGRLRELPIRPGHIVQDNNLLACSDEHIYKVFEILRSQRRIEFAGGFESRRVTDWIVEELRSLSIKHIWLSYDAKGRKASLEQAVARLRAYFSRDQVRCYVLIGYEGDTLEKAEARLKEAWHIGTLPFAMRYRTADPQWDGTFLSTARAWNNLTTTWSRPKSIKGIMDNVGRRAGLLIGQRATQNDPVAHF